MIKILNLYAGIGGNRKLWNGDIEITAVEYDKKIAKIYQDFYPNDIIIVEDAHHYLLKHFREYDFIWASPPCPTHSRLSMSHKNNPKYPDMRLYQEIILLQYFYKGKFVIENVIPYYSYLINPNVIFDRHAFWSNFDIPKKDFNFERKSLIKMTIQDLQEYHKVDLSKYKGIDKTLILRNMVHYEIGKYIFDIAINNIRGEI